MRPNRRRDIQDIEQKYCLCPPSHSSQDHDAKGCHHPVTRFYWDRRDQEFKPMNVPCYCKNAPVLPKDATVVLQSEKS